MNTDLIDFVLSHTTHPGNIGAVARAIKTMGFSRLSLINPKDFPSAEASQRASGAADILDTADVTQNLTDAIADAHCVIGTSARPRTLGIPTVSPRELSEIVADEVGQERKVAILFGTEKSGLSNKELIECHYHVVIPANPEYCSLNLAAAAQLIAYELRCRLIDTAPQTVVSAKDDQSELAEHSEMSLFFDDLETTLVKIGFLNPDNPRYLMHRLKRLYNRARPTKVELNILRGILALSRKHQDES